MCGITGIFAKSSKLSDSELTQVVQSLKTLKARGPDNTSHYQDENVILGHTRLTIIDLSKQANQPLVSDCSRYVLTYNGEIFNYKNLRSELESEGALFKTTSDTEVLLNLLIKKGHQSLNTVRGFFAFALFDKKELSLTLGRDYAGIKPLYYSDGPKRFHFGSEMKAIQEYTIDKTLDDQSLHAFLNFSYIPEPRSVYKSIKKVPPGHVLKVGPQGTQLKKYFKPHFHRTSLDEPIIADLFKKRTVDWMESDVEVGCFLSGGVDSSIVTYLASQNRKNLKTFSISFKNNQFHDESKYARMVSKKFQTDHHQIDIGEEEIEDSIYQVLQYIDEPFADTSCIPSYILCDRVSKHLKVALSGDGADEIWGGYDKYKAELLTQRLSLISPLLSPMSSITQLLPRSHHTKIGNINRKVHKLLSSLKHSPELRYRYWCQFNDESFLTQLYNKDFQSRALTSSIDLIEREMPHFGDFNDFLIKDVFNILPNDMLVKVDRMSMANSLEVRPIFLDQDLFNLGFSISAKEKLSLTRNKKILIKSFQDVLPEEVYNRPKQGFSIDITPFLKSYLHSQPLKSLDYLFEKTKLTQFLAAFKDGKYQDRQSFAWSLVMLDQFLTRHKGF